MSDPLLSATLRAARAGGRAAMRHFRSSRLKVMEKGDGSPVSAADLASNTAILKEIRRAFPGHGILSEETGEQAGDGTHLWIVDPVDGTRSFVRGLPYWTVLLALEVDGRLEASVVHAPALDLTFWARRGKGAFEDGRRLGVSRRGIGEAWALHGPIDCFRAAGLERNFLSLSRRPSIFTGATDALGYAAVARGQVEAFAEGPGPEVWDLAAPRLLVEEAGGRFSDFRGRRTHAGLGSLASNGRVHAELLDALGPIPEDRRR